MISVIIFTCNSEAVLLETLAPLLRPVLEGHIKEVIIWDHGSTDSTFEIADDTGCSFFQSPNYIDSDLENATLKVKDFKEAISKARGNWFLILTDQSVLSENWLNAALKHMQNYPIRAGYFPIMLHPRRWDSLLVEWLLMVRLMITGEPHDIQSLLISRPLFETLSDSEFQYQIEKKGQFDLKKILGKRRLKPILGSHIKTGLLSLQIKFPKNGILITIFSKLRILMGFPPRPSRQ